GNRSLAAIAGEVGALAASGLGAGGAVFPHRELDGKGHTGAFHHPVRGGITGIGVGDDGQVRAAVAVEDNLPAQEVHATASPMFARNLSVSRSMCHTRDGTPHQPTAGFASWPSA